MEITRVLEASRTKIVATVGPACRDEAKLAELAAAGVDVFRLNMAHASQAEHAEVVARIRAVSRAQGRPIAILADLAGPKIRLGRLCQDPLECQEGQILRLVRGEQSTAPDELGSTYQPLVDELAVGNTVMLADGTVSLVVERCEPDAVVCRVVQPGIIRSRQGINLPGVKLRVRALTPVDRENAVWAAEQGIDFVGLSFVRAAANVVELKRLLAEHHATAKVIAKIEKPEALGQLEAIVSAADGVMVARGDLGVEIDVARVPLVQKQIIGVCRRYQKPVIVATQMLESMQHATRPTRAEATDVANAILDGCDACMLSGETAIGEHPRVVVEMMHRIAKETEGALHCGPPEGLIMRPEGLHPVTLAVVHGASQIASELAAKLIVVASQSGATALAVANERSSVLTIGVSDREPTLRQMCLFWGVVPLAGAPADNPVQVLAHVDAWGRREGLLARGDRVVLVAGNALGTGGHNLVIVHEVD